MRVPAAPRRDSERARADERRGADRALKRRGHDRHRRRRRRPSAAGDHGRVHRGGARRCVVRRSCWTSPHCPGATAAGLSSFVFGLGLLLPSVLGGVGLFLLGMRLRLWWRVAAATLFALLAACGGVLAARHGARGPHRRRRRADRHRIPRRAVLRAVRRGATSGRRPARYRPGGGRVHLRRQRDLRGDRSRSASSRTASVRSRRGFPTTRSSAALGTSSTSTGMTSATRCSCSACGRPSP